MIASCVQSIRERIEKAARGAGRDPEEIRLVAVAKGQPVEKILEAIRAGQSDFGENYAQEMLRHQKNIPPQPPLNLRGGVHWHFIGHLQRNKVRQIIDKASLIHSVDSLGLAQEINTRAGKVGKVQPVLIEVNLGGEESKSGIPERELESLIAAAKELPQIELRGLMIIPPMTRTRKNPVRISEG